MSVLLELGLYFSPKAPIAPYNEMHLYCPWNLISKTKILKKGSCAAVLNDFYTIGRDNLLQQNQIKSMDLI